MIENKSKKHSSYKPTVRPIVTYCTHKKKKDLKLNTAESKRRKPRSFVYATIKVEKISENCFGLNLLRQKNSRSEHIHIMLSCESFKCNIKITPLILRHKYQLNHVSNGWFVLQYKANFPISVQQRGNRLCLSTKICKWTKQKFVLT